MDVLHVDVRPPINQDLCRLEVVIRITLRLTQPHQRRRS
eukprot:CAMPEP_0119490304 /NCGR_PEP_ID=MMETSP1344-20130328/15516_1 /TAXON_ID=236787 /ORGANISM="Florenciella parvula, Strain CCMP2471" /LENGTH=38 /DNA_ID= /DNA_START= /DNA_END= /DNA_ORIENTATION=